MVKTMNIHFLIDNQYSRKFILYMNQHYGVENNDFFVCPGNAELKFLNDIENVIVLPGNSIKSILSIRNVVHKSKYKRLFIHCLGDVNLIPLFFKKKTQESIWIAWGGDYYPYINFPLYDKYTSEIIVKTKKRLNIKKLLFRIIRTYVIKYKVDNLAVSKVEYNLITDFYRIYPNRVNFKYPNPVSNSLKFEDKKKNIIKTILIGNSGASSSNHIDAFYKLKNLKGDFKIVVPFSYAYTEDYKRKVFSIGKELFDNRITFLTDFMPPEVYIEVLKNVDVAIMNHFRQQGVGNIRLLINLGIKIYMNEINPFFKVCSDAGISVSKIPYGDFNEDIFDEYSEERKRKNKEGLDSFYSDSLIADYLDKFFKETEFYDKE